MSKYNSTYSKAFQQALNSKYKGNEGKHYNKFDAYNLFTYNEIYQDWLKNSDNQLDELLKSKEFVSLLSSYLALNVDVHKALRNVGYPTYYFDTIFENYIRNTYLASSMQKDFDYLRLLTLNIQAVTSGYCITITKTKTKLTQYLF